MQKLVVNGTYLGQSGFVLEFPDATMLFDWGEGTLPQIRREVPLYIFVSHIHSDHFKWEVLNLLREYPNSEMYLGYDHSVPEFNQELEKYPSEILDKICFFQREQFLAVDTGETDLVISSLESTDMGVAFLIRYYDKTIFHAGDLFLMQVMGRKEYTQMRSLALMGGQDVSFEDYDEHLRNSEKEFISFTEPLKGKKIDYAMLPLDSRVLPVAEKTIKRYMDIADIQCWSPMHLWGKYDFVDEYVSKHPEYAANMIGTTKDASALRKIAVGKKYKIFDASFAPDGARNDISNNPSSNAKSSDWGPMRKTFFWGHPAEEVIFNSMTDNPNIGDERRFVRFRKCSGNDNYSSEGKLEAGEEYEVAIFFHNNARPELNDTGKGVATDVRLRIEAPEVVKKGTVGTIKAFIHSAEGNPKDVWDIAKMQTDSTVLTRYVANSATIHSNGSVDGSILDSNAMYGKNGAYLGYSTNHWGVLPGGEEYAGYVTYRFVVDQPGFKVNSMVRIDGKGDFQKSVIASPGDVLEFQTTYKNTGTINQLAIKVYDAMPQGVEYIKGSTYYTSNFNEAGNYISDNVFAGGANLGDYRPGDWMSITYKAKVSEDSRLFANEETKLYNKVSVATANGTGTVKAEIVIRKK